MIYPIILHHDKSAQYTEALKQRLGTISYGVYDSSLHGTPFSVSFNMALEMFMDIPNMFTHVMVLNNDISLTREQVYELSYMIGRTSGIFSPSSNSPHPEVMAKVGDVPARTVPWLEFICPIISRDVIEQVGFLDDKMSLGWGIDIDYCYRASAFGFGCTLIQCIQIEHYEHKSQDSHRKYGIMAQKEMDDVLMAKYGTEWRRILKFKC